MSLHALAQHMQAKGRNDDSMLVHMTPKEVGGLQALALAHGGSLTVNPQTGLPEAGFLSSILPMIAGFALNAFLPGVGTAIGSALGGLSGAAGTGILVGAGTGLATGSLQKGLMAGLGAYGGAGLGTGITQTGANTLNAVPSSPSMVAPSTSIANSGSAIPGVTGNVSLTNIPQSIKPMPGYENMMDATSYASGINPVSTMDKLGAGVKAGFGNGMDGLKALYGNIPGGTLPALGAYALMGGMGDDKSNIPPMPNQGMIRPYSLDRQQNPDAYNTQIGSNPQRMPVDSRGNLMDSSERTFFTDKYTAGTPYKAPGPEYAADGGLMGLPSYAVGGMPEQQAAFNAVGMNANYPMSQIQAPMYSDPGVQRPMAREVVNPSGDVGVDQFTGEARMAGGGMTAFGGGGVANPQASAPTVDYDYNPKNMEYTQTTTTPPPAGIGGKGLLAQLGRQGNMGSGANGFVNPGLFQGLIPALMQQQQPTVTTKTIGGMSDPYIPPNQTQIPASPQSDIAQYADGGIANLGGYSDGGRLLKGPGDGVSDSIPASIGGRQPARLADGEFVVPARIVSEIGNGSTEAGARKLYKMMDRVQHARRKTVGKNQVAKNTRAEKLLPA